MKKLFSCLLILFSIFSFCPTTRVFAEEVGNNYDIEENEITYKIYNNKGEMIAEKQTVFEGDSILTTDFVKYKITMVDEKNRVAFAEFEEMIKKPKVEKGFNTDFISKENPTICLYMTHNDESYITGDGYDSVYGKGGIHDIAKLLQFNLNQLGINTIIDETLHIPHDSQAYSRSSATAKKLINDNSPDAIFDIHRDGASRKTYVKTVDGIERCKVRIVVGKASKNFEIAEQFAIYLLSVAEEVCDWLFLDIYYASGHYNQGLYSKSLLFEMGSHLVEKNLVKQTVPKLAEVINTALFNTTVDTENGQLTINGNETEKTPIINNALDVMEEKMEIENDKTVSTAVYLVVVVIGGVGLSVVIYGLFKKRKVTKNKSRRVKK